MSDARAAYEAGRDGARALLASLDRQGGHLANARTVAFLTFAGLTLAVVFERLPRLGLVGALAALAAFIALAIVHSGVLREASRAQVRLDLNHRGLQRLDGGWHDFQETGTALIPEGHLNAVDLDVLGHGSLFQRLDETGTKWGEARLAQLLTQPPDSLPAIHARQGAVQELSAKLAFRQALVTEARMASSAKADPTRFIEWSESPSGLAAIAWAWPLAHALPPVTIALGLLAANTDAVSPLLFYGGLAIQIGVVLLTRKPLGVLYAALSRGDRGFIGFEQTFAALDAEAFEHPQLVALQKGIADAASPVSSRLKRFSRLLGLADFRHSGNLHPVINALVLWDIHVLFRVERWRVSDGKGVRRWFEALSELEALSSFAGFAFEHPLLPYPEIVDGPARVEALALAHPLLGAEAVANDVTLPGPGQALVITGSNMSGKTTLMRTLGLTTVMALAGLPVRARRFTCARLTVLTSMRVRDSLERGVSYFYAEVQRIKLLVDTTRAHPDTCLFLLDELFMGTNTRERQIASKQLLRLLLDAGGVGAVTTHDLGLCELETERPGKVRNVHFRDQIEAGEMTFDFRLREGVVQTSNALEVLRRAGVPLGELT